MTLAIDVANATPKIKHRAGMITADFLLFTDPDDHADYPGRRHFATVTVMHDGNPRYRYTASLGNETEEDRGSGFVARGYRLYSSTRLATQEGAKRRSDKAMQAFFDQVMAELPQRVLDDPEIAAYFEVRD